MLFGGRIAEEMVFGSDNVTTGAGNDIRQATEMARRMVTEFGFSDKLGPLRYSDNQEEIFLGHSVTQQKHVSDATARLIDEEVRRLIDEAEDTARRILAEHRERPGRGRRRAARVRDPVRRGGARAAARRTGGTRPTRATNRGIRAVAHRCPSSGKKAARSRAAALKRNRSRTGERLPGWLTAHRAMHRCWRQVA